MEVELMRRIILALAVVALATPSVSCVTSPYNGERVVDSEAPMLFAGYAQSPGIGLSVQGYFVDGGWQHLASATSSTTPTTLGGDTLYEWETSVSFLGEGSRCPFQYNCFLCPGSFGYFRVIEHRSDGDALLTTFEDDGVRCVANKIFGEGLGWLISGYECQSAHSPILRLEATEWFPPHYEDLFDGVCPVTGSPPPGY
jgi:hypothetical protein